MSEQSQAPVVVLLVCKWCQLPDLEVVLDIFGGVVSQWDGGHRQANTGRASRAFLQPPNP